MSKNDRFDGYTVEVWQDEDGDWMARLAEMPSISAFGNSPEKAISELDVAWGATKESYLVKGDSVPVAPNRKKYSGQFNVRIAKDLHRRLALEAVRKGISLDALVAGKLAAG